MARFAIVGGGMAGILTAIKLKEAGFSDFTLYEKAERLGGTWRDNTYPGVACDVPSHLYCYSFAPNPEWSFRFAPGGEIEAYLERVAREHDVYAHVRFGQEVTQCTWEAGRWRLGTQSGLADAVDFVIMATGVLHRPRMPVIEGLERFEGACFHSARWRHDVALDGKRVGVIGTGSSGVQIVPAIVDRVAHLALFQRTPQWVMPQENPRHTEQEIDALREQPERIRHIRSEFTRLFVEGFSNAVIDAESPQAHAIEAACRAHLEQSVEDPALRARLLPSYRAACKRLVISPNFYRALQQPVAELVSERIERVEPRGVRTADGRLHELDVLVLATGFHVDAFMRPMHVTGRGGRTLEQVWAARPSAYLSISIPGFPNLFMLNGPNGPVGNFSLIDVAEMQLAYILQLVDEVNAGRCKAICADTEAAARFERARSEAALKTVWSTGCKSWYLDDRGVPMAWPWTFERFRTEMAAPKLEDYERE